MRDRAEAVGIGNRAGQLGIAHALHTALHNRVFDTQHFGDARLDRYENPS